MKQTLTYCGHLCVATLVVPWLTLMVAAGLAFGIARPFITSTQTPQQFYSEHGIFLAAITGVLLSYSTSGIFTSKSAMWVWIPVTAVFVFRVLDWHASGSVLVGSGSLVEHFFTANCEIQNWRDATFDTRCPDKLFLTPLFLGSVAYSVGAAIHRVTHCWRPAEGSSIQPTEGIVAPRRLVTTRFGAFLALALAGSFLGSRLHAEVVSAHQSSWRLLDFGFFPTWMVVAINIAFWSGIYVMGIGFARAPLRKDEKAILVSLGGTLMLSPIASLFPRISGLVHIAQTMLCLTAFLAALTILLSLFNERSHSLPSAQRVSETLGES